VFQTLTNVDLGLIDAAGSPTGLESDDRQEQPICHNGNERPTPAGAVSASPLQDREPETDEGSEGKPEGQVRYGWKCCQCNTPFPGRSKRLFFVLRHGFPEPQKRQCPEHEVYGEDLGAPSSPHRSD